MMTLKSGRKTSHALQRLPEVQHGHTIAMAVKPPESPHSQSTSGTNTASPWPAF